MRFASIRFPALVGLCIVFSVWQGCVPYRVTYRDSISREAQTIQVSSEPQGAIITIKDENGSRILGRAPVVLNLGYDVVVRTNNKASCALGGATAVANVLDDHDGETSESEAAVGLVGMLVGAVVGASMCAEADGVVAVQPKSLMVGAQLDGYQSQEIAIQAPKETAYIHFELLPVQKAIPEKETRKVHTVEPGKLVVFDLQPSGGDIEATLVEDASAYLTECLLKSYEFKVVDRSELSAQLTDPATGQARACPDVSCRRQVSSALSAQYFLDTRIMKTKANCILSAMLIDAGTGQKRLVLAHRTSCDRTDIMHAMDRISEMIVSPPEQSERPSRLPAYPSKKQSSEH